MYDIGIIDIATRNRAQKGDEMHLGRRILTDAIKAGGYDGLIYKNMWEGDIKGENTSYVVFDPEQIKSVFAGFIFCSQRSSYARDSRSAPG